ncbi:ctr copper transporter [Xylariales sp. PMI_506]|nr:ctr copper transporter [Xylariales sp. PMI_506]
MDMSSSSTDSSTCKISMLWNWYTIDACFLSSTWHITNNGMFAASCIGVILLVVSLELLRRVGKEYDSLIIRQFQRQAALQQRGSNNDAGSCCPAETASSGVLTFRASPLQQLVRAVIHAVTFGVAYIIMLLAMYFNGYIIICIFIGAGIGKFLCDWMVFRIELRVTNGQSVDKGGIDEPTVCCG